MRTEEEIREKIKQNREKMNADRISQSFYMTLAEQNETLKWVLNE